MTVTVKKHFGRAMRDTHFLFSPSYRPLNHGSFGAYPHQIQEVQSHYQKLQHERPDTFIVYDLPSLIDTSRAAISPLLGCDTDEVVFIPNATTGVNVTLRNLKFEERDVVLYFSTIYPACEKTVANLEEMGPVRGVKVEIEFPITEEEILRKFREGVEAVRVEGRRVRLAIFDTVLTFPGVRMPWEALVGVCTEMGILSLIDGAHGIGVIKSPNLTATFPGQIDLTYLGQVQPDFFVSNCHKWLYTPRGCAVFYVPFKNQHLIRTSLPTSHGYAHPKIPGFQSGKSPFVMLFQFVATIDYTPYLSIPAAIEFRERICGGEQEIRRYCFELAERGGGVVAGILGTHVLVSGENSGTSGKRSEGENGERGMGKCSFAMVALPLVFRKLGNEESEVEVSGGAMKTFSTEDAGKIGWWINKAAVKEFDTYLQVGFHSGSLWVRLSAQIYLDLRDFEWVGHKLKELCERIQKLGISK